MNAKTQGRRRRDSRYPWAAWFAKGRFVLKKGRDYTVPSYSMAQQVRNWGSPYRYAVGRLSIDVREDRITVVLLDRQSPGRN